jgi:hypothetical protein
MTQASFPFEGIDTTETQFSKWARHFNNGVNDEPTGDALEVSAGTGLAVEVEAGEAMVRGHYYTSDAVESLALATADPTDDRIDVIVLRLDPTANSIVLAVKTGTPAGAPVAPTLVQSDDGIFEQPLANVLVPATAGVPSTITDRREFMGTRLGSWTTAGRPTPAGRVLFGFNTTDEAVEFYDPINDVWGPVAPAIDELNDIGDVVITTPADGELLAYDDGDWVNQALTSAQLPTGSILQVVSTAKTDAFTMSGTVLTDITGLSASITPSATSSKILVLASVAVGGASGVNGALTILLRGATPIAVSDSAGSRAETTSMIENLSPSAPQTTNVSFLDSPNTTSAVTYKFQTRSNNASTVFVNRTVTDSDNSAFGRSVSTITLLEVAG